ncbi:dihydrolipoyl dehydrogenase [Gellertiella hungarica]|uniref:Dihydrolipoyl dehydrogenase n=1 Tax=Gellertiella hungarica TaxID=1572859 RepID=A0A7W6J7E2_9HYPH|nr:dihydrolipoyl dehydrogenase [Gellertiella hungarica]MBB4066191.1 dihydrolipoamide dehydrogenase [Gellertiella hungarica]
MKEIHCKLLVIGAGPGGYVAAIRAGQLGIDTVIVERARPGGTCLNIGCIPSKALIHAAEDFHAAVGRAGKPSPTGLSHGAPSLDFSATQAWKSGIVGRLTGGVAALLKKAGVKTVVGHARFRDGRTVAVETEIGTQVIHAENTIIATGSAPVELPVLPFGGNIISSTEALSLGAVPESLTVIGGGYIGVELGTAYAKLGARVTIVEAQPRILPLYDAALVRPVEKRLASLGVTLLTGTRIKGGSEDGLVTIEGTDGRPREIRADKVLVTVGRRPVTEGWGREELVLDMAGPFIRIDERCRTSMRGIYAIGDVTGEPMLAHRAMAQGEMVAELVAGRSRLFDKRVIPAVCFSSPEVVSAGLSPEEAKAAGYETVQGQFPFLANGRAMTLGSDDGFVRIVARADNHLVLGIQAVGEHVSELSAAFALAIEMGARLEDVAGTIHAHPTLSEAFPEAAMAALGHGLHM